MGLGDNKPRPFSKGELVKPNLPSRDFPSDRKYEIVGIGSNIGELGQVIILTNAQGNRTECFASDFHRYRGNKSNRRRGSSKNLDYAHHGRYGDFGTPLYQPLDVVNNLPGVLKVYFGDGRAEESLKNVEEHIGELLGLEGRLCLVDKVLFDIGEEDDHVTVIIRVDPNAVPLEKAVLEPFLYKFSKDLKEYIILQEKKANKKK